MTLSIAHHVYNQVQLRHLLSRECFFKVSGRLFQYKKLKKGNEETIILNQSWIVYIFLPSLPDISKSANGFGLS